MRARTIDVHQRLPLLQSIPPCCSPRGTGASPAAEEPTAAPDV